MVHLMPGLLRQLFDIWKESIRALDQRLSQKWYNMVKASDLIYIACPPGLLYMLCVTLRRYKDVRSILGMKWWFTHRNK